MARPVACWRQGRPSMRRSRAGHRCSRVFVSPEPAVISAASPEVIELLSETVQRWTIRRKAAVINAVNAGEVTREEMCGRHQISIEELLSWQRDYETHGLYGLRSTRLQIYRRLAARGRDQRSLGAVGGDGR
jgi:hypothetical protein